MRWMDPLTDLHPGEVLKDANMSQGHLRAKTRVFVDVSKANIAVRCGSSLNRQPSSPRPQKQVFPDAQNVNPRRGLEKYLVTDCAGR